MYVIARKSLGYKETIIGREVKESDKINELNKTYKKEVKYWKVRENFKECIDFKAILIPLFEEEILKFFNEVIIS